MTAVFTGRKEAGLARVIWQTLGPGQHLAQGR